MCAPTTQIASSGQWVYFAASYSATSNYFPYQLEWTAVGGTPATGFGTSFSTQFFTSSINETRVISVNDGYQTAFCNVYVSGVTPTPTPTLNITPSYVNTVSGALVNFSVTGGNGVYSWNAPSGTPSYGSGTSFSTRFYNNSSVVQPYTVSVTSNGQTRTATVQVSGSTTPTPTPTANVTLTLAARNVSAGQSGEHASVRARAGDTIDFLLHVRSQSNQYFTNIVVTDYLPAGITYIAGSTTLNGYSVADGVTSSGFSIGGLSGNQEAIVKFSARVDTTGVPTWGYVTVVNTAQVRADSYATVSGSMNVLLGQSNLGAVAGVATGPADSLLLALAAAVLATGYYAWYTRKEWTLAPAMVFRKTDMNFSR